MSGAPGEGTRYDEVVGPNGEAMMMAGEGVEDAEVLQAIPHDVTCPKSPPAFEDRACDCIRAALTRLQERVDANAHDAAMYHECRDQWKAQAESLAARAEAAEALAAQRLDYIDGLHESWVAAEAKVKALEAALREVVNTLGPEHFGGELEGLVVEGNEALRVALAALDRQEP